MLAMKIDLTDFNKTMNNAIQYSVGFMEGVERGKPVFLQKMGKSVIEAMKQFIDANARVNPAMLQHVYEWEQSGNPNSRLFELNYRSTKAGISIGATFRQSASVKPGSYVPFYDKARIMESGIPVTIAPVRAKVLAFETEEGTVFTKGPVTVKNPGGEQAARGLENTIDVFVNQYFSQSFLKMSGLGRYIERAELFKRDFRKAKNGGKAAGVSAGYRWIVNAEVDL